MDCAIHLLGDASRQPEIAALNSTLSLSRLTVLSDGTHLPGARQLRGQTVLLLLSGTTLASPGAAASLARLLGGSTRLLLATPPPVSERCGSPPRRTAAAERTRQLAEEASALEPTKRRLGVVEFEDALMAPGMTLACNASLASRLVAELVAAAACGSHPSPLQREESRPPRVAVCFGAWVGAARVLEDGGRSIRENLVAPLGASIIMALRWQSAADCSHGGAADSPARQCMSAMRADLPDIGAIARLEMVETPSLQEQVGVLEGSAHWPRVLHAFNHGSRCGSDCGRFPKTCRRVENWEDKTRSPYKCNNLWNTYLTPVFSSHGSFNHNLIKLFDLSRVIDALGRRGLTRQLHGRQGRQEGTRSPLLGTRQQRRCALIAWCTAGSRTSGWRPTRL